MSEVLFYHLERQTLEQVLPLLLEKTLERGWRAVVQADSQERVEALSSSLWTWRDDAFLPHGDVQDGFAEHQPIWICADDETPNAANVRFCVDGTTAREIDDFERIVYMFDGNNASAVEHAREQWKALKDTPHEITYWRQNTETNGENNGKWEKVA